jgi:hypothetical protein
MKRKIKKICWEVFFIIISFIMSQLNPQRSQTGTEKTFGLETRRKIATFLKMTFDRCSTSFYFLGGTSDWINGDAF